MNLGPNAGVTVASALLVDYVLTVAVSISSGAQYAATALPAAARARGGVRGRARGAADHREPARRQGVRAAPSPSRCTCSCSPSALIAVVGAIRLLHAATCRWPRARSFDAARRQPPFDQGLIGPRRLLPHPARVRVGLCRADRRRGHQQRRAGVQEAEVEERRDHARAARRPVDHDDHVDPAARPRHGRDVRRRPADAAAGERRARWATSYVQHPVISQLSSAVFQSAPVDGGLRRHRHRPHPRARGQHGVQRLPRARLDPRARRVPAAAAAHPRRPAGVLQRHRHPRRWSRSC